MTKPPPHLYSLGLNDEFDDKDLFDALERSFGIKFERPIMWVTVADLYETVLDRLPASAAPGKCAALMAFHRLRRALRKVLATDARIVPETRLRELTRRPASHVERELFAEMGLPRPSSAGSRFGCLGVLFLALGVIAIPLSLVVHRLWPMIALVLLGPLMIRLDPGVFADRTVGRMARSIASQNYGLFIQDGADTRPETIWALLTEALGDVCGMPASFIRPDTRLI